MSQLPDSRVCLETGSPEVRLRFMDGYGRKGVSNFGLVFTCDARRPPCCAAWH